jgi:RhtB (resistance to homoserine/threonine) family protein
MKVLEVVRWVDHTGVKIMTNMESFLLFLVAAVMLNIAPGPDTIYVVTRSVAQGRRAGMLSSFGVCSGALIHTFAAAFGLSAILAASAYAFQAVKYAGAAYLVYLGVKSILEKRGPLHIDSCGDAALSNWHLFRQGVMIDVLNPKVALFFLAFLPQFIDPSSGSKASQFLILGIIVILIGLVWEALLVLLSTCITRMLRENESFGVWLNRIMGAVFIGLGLRLAKEKL